MKRIIIAIALAFAFALPVTGPALADPEYRPRNDSTHVWQHSFARGSVRCKVHKHNVVKRSWGENWAQWIYVDVIRRPNDIFRKCHGWIDKRQFKPLIR